MSLTIMKTHGFLVPKKSFSFEATVFKCCQGTDCGSKEVEAPASGSISALTATDTGNTETKRGLKHLVQGCSLLASQL